MLLDINPSTTGVVELARRITNFQNAEVEEVNPLTQPESDIRFLVERKTGGELDPTRAFAPMDQIPNPVMSDVEMMAEGIMSQAQAFSMGLDI